MKTVWKFGLEFDDSQRVNMPAGAELLSVGSQGDSLFVWAVVDSQAHLEPRTFLIRGTGHPLPNTPLRFLGRATTHDEQLVWHIFEDIGDVVR